LVGTDNKTIFRRLYENSWNSGDLAVVDELLASDFVNHEVVKHMTTPHRELYERAIVETRGRGGKPQPWLQGSERACGVCGALSAGEATLPPKVGSGLRPVGKVTALTNHCPLISCTYLEGLPHLTGDRFEVRGISIARAQDGKIVEFWKQQSNPQAS
jgi:hypothetical protein